MTNRDRTARILASIAANPGAPNHRIAKNLKLPVSAIAAVRGATVPAPEVPTSGFCLKSAKVVSRRPVESAAKYIKRLPKDQGFLPKDLASQWGMSEETIKNHARSLGCMKFVEVTEDEWQPMVLNPETAAKYNH